MSSGYRTATEMEMAREDLIRITGDEDTTNRILFFFKSLAGRSGDDFEVNLEYLFDHVLETSAGAFGPNFARQLAQMVRR